MPSCAQCGGPVAKHDAQCSYCGAPNDAVPLSAQVEVWLARGIEAIQQERNADAVLQTALTRVDHDPDPKLLPEQRTEIRTRAQQELHRLQGHG